jgi:hypothetical protein
VCRCNLTHFDGGCTKDGIYLAVYLVFRFVTGFAAAAFLSVAGGSVGDMFTDDKVASYGFSYDYRRRSTDRAIDRWLYLQYLHSWDPN